jgi:hypothetical protein
MQKTLHETAPQYNPTWLTMAGITEGMKNTRIKYLTGQLPTAKNLCRYKVKKTPLCPCCHKHPDSGHHAVACCPAIMGMVQEKHNKVVRCITKAIAQGDKGAHQIVYTDGGSLTKWEAGQAGELHKTMSHLPPDLLTAAELKQCKSKPDILMYRKASTTTKNTPTGYDPLRAPEINIIEFKFVRDTTPTLNATNPHKQHSKLVTLLRAKHPEAHIHPRIILLGIAGTIYNEYTIRQLQQLGVRGPQLKTTIHKMQTIAIQDLHATWMTRQGKLRPPKQAKGPQPPPAHRPQATPQQGGRHHYPPGGVTPGT